MTNKIRRKWKTTLATKSKHTQLTKSLASKNRYESMNRSPIVTAFSRSLTQQFVRKTKGDYENDNFRVMVTAVDKYLIGKNKNAKLFLREVLKV